MTGLLGFLFGRMPNDSNAGLSTDGALYTGRERTKCVLGARRRSSGSRVIQTR